MRFGSGRSAPAELLLYTAIIGETLFCRLRVNYAGNLPVRLRGRIRADRKPGSRAQTITPRAARVACHRLVELSEHHRSNLQYEAQRNSDYPRLDNPLSMTFYFQPINTRKRRPQFHSPCALIALLLLSTLKRTKQHVALALLRPHKCPVQNNGCPTQAATK